MSYNNNNVADKDPRTQGVKGLKGVNRGVKTPDTSNLSYEEEAVLGLNKNPYSDFLNRTYQNTKKFGSTSAVLMNLTQGDFALQNDAFGESVYDKKVKSLQDFDNLNNFRGEQQSGALQLLNGALKGGITFGTTFLSGTVGTVWGIGAAIIDGDLSSFSNNYFANIMSDISKWSERELPNYYTDRELNADWWDNMTTANFWGDKFIKNMGFAGGAIHSGKAWAMLGKVGFLKKVLENSKYADNIKTYVGSAISAFNEGNIEAKNAADEYFEDNREKAFDTYNKAMKQLAVMGGATLQNGGLDDMGNLTSKGLKLAEAFDPDSYATYSNALKQDFNRIEENSKHVANYTLLGNMPILMAENMMLFGTIFKGGAKTARGTIKGIKGDLGELYKNFSTAKNAGKAFAKTKVGEFGEEFSQGVMSNSAKDLYTYDAEQYRMHDYYDKEIDKTKTGLHFMWNTLSTAVEDWNKTNSLFEEGILGAISGGTGIVSIHKSNSSKMGIPLGPIKLSVSGGTYQHFQELQAKDKYEKEVIDNANKYYKDPNFRGNFQNALKVAVEESNRDQRMSYEALKLTAEDETQYNRERLSGYKKLESADKVNGEYSLRQKILFHAMNEVQETLNRESKEVTGEDKPQGKIQGRRVQNYDGREVIRFYVINPDGSFADDVTDKVYNRAFNLTEDEVSDPKKQQEELLGKLEAVEKAAGSNKSKGRFNLLNNNNAEEQQQKDALLNDDVFLYKNSEARQFANIVSHFAQVGELEYLKYMTNTLYSTDKESTSALVGLLTKTDPITGKKESPFHDSLGNEYSEEKIVDIVESGKNKMLRAINSIEKSTIDFKEKYGNWLSPTHIGELSLMQSTIDNFKYRQGKINKSIEPYLDTMLKQYEDLLLSYDKNIAENSKYNLEGLEGLYHIRREYNKKNKEYQELVKSLKKEIEDLKNKKVKLESNKELTVEQKQLISSLDLQIKNKNKELKSTTQSLYKNNSDYYSKFNKDLEKTSEFPAIQSIIEEQQAIKQELANTRLEYRRVLNLMTNKASKKRFSSYKKDLLDKERQLKNKLKALNNKEKEFKNRSRKYLENSTTFRLINETLDYKALRDKTVDLVQEITNLKNGIANNDEVSYNKLLELLYDRGDLYNSEVKELYAKTGINTFVNVPKVMQKYLEDSIKIALLRQSYQDKLQEYVKNPNIIDKDKDKRAKKKEEKRLNKVLNAVAKELEKRTKDKSNIDNALYEDLLKILVDNELFDASKIQESQKKLFKLSKKVVKESLSWDFLNQVGRHLEAIKSLNNHIDGVFTSITDYLDSLNLRELDINFDKIKEGIRSIFYTKNIDQVLNDPKFNTQEAIAEYILQMFNRFTEYADNADFYRMVASFMASEVLNKLFPRILSDVNNIKDYIINNVDETPVSDNKKNNNDKENNNKDPNEGKPIKKADEDDLYGLNKPSSELSADTLVGSIIQDLFNLDLDTIEGITEEDFLDDSFINNLTHYIESVIRPLNKNNALEELDNFIPGSKDQYSAYVDILNNKVYREGNTKSTYKPKFKGLVRKIESTIFKYRDSWDEIEPIEEESPIDTPKPTPVQETPKPNEKPAEPKNPESDENIAETNNKVAEAIVENNIKEEEPLDVETQEGDGTIGTVGEFSYSYKALKTLKPVTSDEVLDNDPAFSNWSDAQKNSFKQLIEHLKDLGSFDFVDQNSKLLEVHKGKIFFGTMQVNDRESLKVLDKEGNPTKEVIVLLTNVVENGKTVTKVLGALQTNSTQKNLEENIRSAIKNSKKQDTKVTLDGKSGNKYTIIYKDNVHTTINSINAGMLNISKKVEGKTVEWKPIYRATQESTLVPGTILGYIDNTANKVIFSRNGSTKSISLPILPEFAKQLARQSNGSPVLLIPSTNNEYKIEFLKHNTWSKNDSGRETATINNIVDKGSKSLEDYFHGDMILEDLKALSSTSDNSDKAFTISEVNRRISNYFKDLDNVLFMKNENIRLFYNKKSRDVNGVRFPKNSVVLSITQHDKTTQGHIVIGTYENGEFKLNDNINKDSIKNTIIDSLSDSFYYRFSEKDTTIYFENHSNSKDNLHTNKVLTSLNDLNIHSVSVRYNHITTEGDIVNQERKDPKAPSNLKPTTQGTESKKGPKNKISKGTPILEMYDPVSKKNIGNIIQNIFSDFNDFVATNRSDNNKITSEHYNFFLNLATLLHVFNEDKKSFSGILEKLVSLKMHYFSGNNTIDERHKNLLINLIDKSVRLNSKFKSSSKILSSLKGTDLNYSNILDTLFTNLTGFTFGENVAYNVVKSTGINTLENPITVKINLPNNNSIQCCVFEDTKTHSIKAVIDTTVYEDSDNYRYTTEIDISDFELIDKEFTGDKDVVNTKNKTLVEANGIKGLKSSLLGKEDTYYILDGQIYNSKYRNITSTLTNTQKTALILTKEYYDRKQVESTKSNTKSNTKAITKNIEVVYRYTTREVSNNPNKVYVFGDNTQRVGSDGQAVIRDLDNAFGIPTKKAPSRDRYAYFNDNELDSNKKIIDASIDELVRLRDAGKTIVFPKDGLGTGLAKLATKAPKTFWYLSERLKKEFGFNNIEGTLSKKEVNIYSSDKNDYEVLSNMTLRDFYIKNQKFNSVEQAFHYFKAIIAGNEKLAQSIIKMSPWKSKAATKKGMLNFTPQQLKHWDSVKGEIMTYLIYRSVLGDSNASSKLKELSNYTITHKTRTGYNADPDGIFISALTTVSNALLNNKTVPIPTILKDLMGIEESNEDFSVNIFSNNETSTKQGLVKTRSGFVFVRLQGANVNELVAFNPISGDIITANNNLFTLINEVEGYTKYNSVTEFIDNYESDWGKDSIITTDKISNSYAEYKKSLPNVIEGRSVINLIENKDNRLTTIGRKTYLMQEFGGFPVVLPNNVYFSGLSHISNLHKLFDTQNNLIGINITGKNAYNFYKFYYENFDKIDLQDGTKIHTTIRNGSNKIYAIISRDSSQKGVNNGEYIVELYKEKPNGFDTNNNQDSNVTIDGYNKDIQAEIESLAANREVNITDDIDIDDLDELDKALGSLSLLDNIDTTNNSEDVEYRDPNSISNDEFFREVDFERGTNKNIIRELKVLHSILPQLTTGDRIKIYKGLLETSKKGVKAWGKFKKGMIILSDQAPEGTLYHEAFHYVFNTMLSKEDSKAILDETKSKYNVKNDLEAEEVLAEKYREFANKYFDNSIGGRVLRFFKQLQATVRSWFNLSSYADSLFWDISKGNFAEEIDVEYNRSEFDKLSDNVKDTLRSQEIDSTLYNSLSKEIQDYVKKCAGA